MVRSLVHTRITTERPTDRHRQTEKKIFRISVATWAFARSTLIRFIGVVVTAQFSTKIQR